MHFLITGGTGAGKTLFTLKWVRDLQLESGRPVCYTSAIRLKPAAESFGWRLVDVKSWESEPDGTIFIVDECHKDFPVRGGTSVPPRHVQMLAEARHRGFDFFFVTQHPKNLDVFIRRLIAAPGWHRHIKRRSGAPLASVLQWDSVYERVERNDAGAAGAAEVTHAAYPKQVYAWYESTSLDTAKLRIPRALYAVVAAVVVGPLLLWVAFSSMAGGGGSSPDASAVASAVAAPSGGGLVAAVSPPRVDSRAASGGNAPLSAAEYLAQHKSRVPGLPHTAPRYDGVTAARYAPYPAACLRMGARCSCYTQQGTLMHTPPELCSDIVARGIFLDWDARGTPDAAPAAAPGSGHL